MFEVYAVMLNIFSTQMHIFLSKYDGVSLYQMILFFKTISFNDKEGTKLTVICNLK